MFLGFGHASRKGAKTLSSEEKISHSESNSLPLLQPLRLGAFAGDIPAPFFCVLCVLCGHSFFRLRLCRARFFAVKKYFLYNRCASQPSTSKVTMSSASKGRARSVRFPPCFKASTGITSTGIGLSLAASSGALISSRRDSRKGGLTA